MKKHNSFSRIWHPLSSNGLLMMEDTGHKPHGVQVEHRRLQLCQLNSCDAHGPNITQLIVAPFSLDCGHLRCHPTEKDINRKTLYTCDYSSMTRIKLLKKNPPTQETKEDWHTNMEFRWRTFFLLKWLISEPKLQNQLERHKRKVRERNSVVLFKWKLI